MTSGHWVLLAFAAIFVVGSVPIHGAWWKGRRELAGERALMLVVVLWEVLAVVTVGYLVVHALAFMASRSA